MRFYTTEDLQQILQIGHKQAKALMRAEGFPSIRIGRSYRVEEEAFMDLHLGEHLCRHFRKK